MKKVNHIHKYVSILVILALFVAPIQSCQKDEIITVESVEKTSLNITEKKTLLKNFQDTFVKSSNKLARLTSNKKEFKNKISPLGYTNQNLSAEQLKELKVLEYESKTFIKNYCSLTDEDLIKISGGKNQECFIILSMLILETEKVKNKKFTKNNINLKSLARSTSANPELEWSEVGECALIALGADLLYGSAFTGAAATKWTVKAIRKTFGIIASRALGPVGVGIAAGTFSYCLYEQNQD